MKISEPSFLERFSAASGQLSELEVRVCRWISSHPEKVVSSTAAELAEEADTSDATVVRIAKKLGYSGYKALKTEILDEAIRRRDTSLALDHRVGRLEGSDRPAFLLLQDTVSAINALAQDIDHEAIAQATKLALSARRVFAYGLGPGASVASFLAISLVRLGVDAASLERTGYRLADDLLGLRRGDTIFLFAPIHQTVEVETIVDFASEQGVAVILITEVLGLTLRDRVSLVIPMPSTGNLSISETFLPHIFCQIILMQVAKDSKSRAVDGTRLFNRLSSTLTGEPDFPSPPFVR